MTSSAKKLPSWSIAFAGALLTTTSALAGTSKARCWYEDGIWVTQIQSVGEMTKREVGICLDPSKSHEFGALNEKEPTSVEVIDFVSGEKFAGATLFEPGVPVQICNYSDSRMHHGGPAATSLLNPLESDECKLVYPTGWREKNGSRFFALTGIWTPADVQKDIAAVEAREKPKTWQPHPKDPNKWEDKFMRAERIRGEILEREKAAAEAEAAKNPKVSTRKKKGGGGSKTSGAAKSGSAKSKKSGAGN